MRLSAEDIAFIGRGQAPTLHNMIVKNALGNEIMDTSLIQSHTQIMMGKPIIVGTRITVESILERLSAGETPEQIVAANPRLTIEAVLASFAFAAQALRADVIFPLVEQAA